MTNFKEGIFALMAVLILVPSFTTASIDDYLDQQYVYESSENFGAVLSALGLWYLRPIAPLWYPNDCLRKSGDVYTYISVSILAVLNQDFRLDDKKNVKTLDGRNVKSSFTADGDTLRELQEETNGRVTIIDREFTKETLTIKIKVGSITAVRYHKKYTLPKKGSETEEEKNIEKEEEDQ